MKIQVLRSRYVFLTPKGCSKKDIYHHKCRKWNDAVKRNAVVVYVVKSIDDDDDDDDDVVFGAERRAGDFRCCFRGTALDDAEGRARAITPVRVVSNVGRRDGEISVVVVFFLFRRDDDQNDDDDDDSNRGDPCRGDGWMADIFIEREANALATDTRKLSKRVRR